MTKYNYTDTFRSTLELATEEALRLGYSRIFPELLLWAILKERSNIAVHFLRQQGVDIQQLYQELELMLTSNAPKQEADAQSGETPSEALYNPYTQTALHRAALLCSALQDQAISPLHLLLGIYMGPSYALLNKYIEKEQLPEELQAAIAKVRELEAPQRVQAQENPEDDAEAAEKKPDAVEVTVEVISNTEQLKRSMKSNARLLSPEEAGKILSDLLDGSLGSIRINPEDQADEEEEEVQPKGERPSEERKKEMSEEEKLYHLKKTFLEYGSILTLTHPIYERYAMPPDFLRGRVQLELERILIPALARYPVLVGDPYVGKTSCLLNLALRIDQGQVAEGFRYKHALLLSFGKLETKATEIGSYEHLIRALSNLLLRHPDILLLIDGLEYFIQRKGSSPELLTTLLYQLRDRGIRFVATARSDEYKQILKSSSLAAKHLVAVPVEPLAKGEDLDRFVRQMVRQIRLDYQIDLKPSEEELLGQLTTRYFGQLPQPHATVELLNAAASLARLRVGSIPTPGVRSKRKLYPDDLYRAVAQLTQLPLERISGKSELEQLRLLPERLGARVLGQEEAVRKIAYTIQRNRLGLSDDKRPASFFFLGPTGVGKTYLAKTLAKELFGSEDAMVRIDMSEFAESFAVTRLIGAPPGYIGFERGGELTEPIRTKPYSIILLDELEKAHPRVYDLLLQLLEDGRLTDSEGQVVDFRHCIIIMTSNIGSREAQDFAQGVGFTPQTGSERSEEIVRKALSRRFSPEFIGRIDEFISFAPLEQHTLEDILRLELQPLQLRAAERGYGLHLSQEAIAWLATRPEERPLGARPLRRRLQQYVERPLMEHILREELRSGQQLAITLIDGVLHYSISAQS